LFTDAAFANLNKTDSTQAYVIFLIDENYHCCALDWKATKIKRVVTSTAAEALSLQEGIGDAIFLREVIIEILNLKSKIPIVAYTDHKGLVDSVYSTCSVDKLLRINIAAIKQLDVLVLHVDGEKQLANCLDETKCVASITSKDISNWAAPETFHLMISISIIQQSVSFPLIIP
jgi:hypothetical protein